MANKVVIKRTSVVGREPLATDIDVGELAVNLADKKLFTKDGAGTVIQLGGGSGTGDVVGPTSSSDNAIARFDSTTGKLIQNSVVIVDDTGSITGVNALTAESLVINNDATIGSSNTDTLDVKSRIVSDLDPNSNNAKDIGSSGRNWRDGFFGRTLHTLNLELTGTTTFDGSQGTSGQVLTSAGTGNTPTWTTPTTGTVTSVAATGGTGISISGSPITSSGTLTITNTAPDQTVSLSGGGTTTIGGTYPSFTISSADQFSGTVTSVAVSGGTTGLTTSGGPITGSGTITIAGTLAVANGGTGSTTAANARTALSAQETLVSGTNIKTVNSTSILGSGNIAVGTVTGVTGTAPIISSGGTAPAISISAATTSAAGSMSSADKTKLDGIATGATANAGTVTSVAATVPTGLTITGSPIISSGTLAISYTSGYAIPTTAKQTEWDTAFTDRNKWDGGATGLVASTGRTSLGGTTLGSNIFTITNPSAITFPRFNADNTVSALSATDFRTAIGAGTGNGTVTGVSGTAPISSSGGATPAISISQSNGSTNGFLSSTDWNTFNNKQATLVSGTNIKTINGDSVLGSGNLVVSAPIVYQ